MTLEETGNRSGSSMSRNNDFITAMTLSRDTWVSIAKIDNHRHLEVLLGSVSVEFSIA